MLQKQFRVKDLGDLKFFLEIEVGRSSKGTVLNQRYALELISYLRLTGNRTAQTSME